MKKGFTLVELSIVLVVVGLLISGILIGQSLISSAQLNSVISQLQQYNVAADIFQQKFKQFPGDSNLFTPAGDNNKITDGSACRQTSYSGEQFYIYSHLSQSQMINKNFDIFRPSSCGGPHSTNVWVAKDKRLWPVVKVGNTSSSVMYYKAAQAEYMQFHPDRLDAVALDQKVDDGNNASGIIRAIGTNGSGVAATCDKDDTITVCNTRYIPDPAYENITQCDFYYPGNGSCTLPDN